MRPTEALRTLKKATGDAWEVVKCSKHCYWLSNGAVTLSFAKTPRVSLCKKWILNELRQKEREVIA